MPRDIAALAGRTHVVAALFTSDLRVAKIKSAHLFFSLASIYDILRLKMGRMLDIDGEDLGRLEMLVGRAFALGQEHRARIDAVNQEFSVLLKQLTDSVRGSATQTDMPFSTWGGADDMISVSAARERISALAGSAFATPQSVYTSAPVSPSWTALKQAFFDDKPDLTEKTLMSYNQAFDIWQGLIGAKPIGEIRRPDLKLFADHMRDKPNARGGQLNHKTIERSLGHIKTFMGWAVAAGHANDDRFGDVKGRDKTREERLSGEKRRAFTAAELERLFGSPLFHKPKNEDEQTEAWFLLIAALTGARTEEIADAPAEFIKVGDILCLDLRKTGTKTAAAPRLVPLMTDLIKLGLPSWAERQMALGRRLVQSGAEGRSAAAWSKRLNRYIDEHVSASPAVVLYSLRHNFRQMLRAANIGDELSDKIFGHSSGKVGAAYGRALSHDEAELFMKNLKSPVDITQLAGRNTFLSVTSKSQGSTASSRGRKNA
jgi:integrase